MPTRHYLPASLPRWIYEHVWRLRVDLLGLSVRDFRGIERLLLTRHPSARLLVRRAQADRLSLALPERNGQSPRPPFDLAAIGLPGVLRLFVYPHQGGLRAAVTTKAAALDALSDLLRFVRGLLGPAVLGAFMDDSREFYVVASRAAAVRASARPGSWLGSEREDCTFVLLASWRGPGTAAAGPLYGSLRWYSFDDPEWVKIEARVGAHHRRRHHVEPMDLRRAAEVALASVMALEGLACAGKPSLWIGRALPAGPDWLGDAELRTIQALARMDAAAPVVRLHPLAEVSARADLSASHATEVLGSLGEYRLVSLFDGADAADKRLKHVRVSEHLSLFTAARNDPTSLRHLVRAATLVRPFYSSTVSLVGPGKGNLPRERESDDIREFDHPEGPLRLAAGRGTAEGPCGYGSLRVPRHHGHGPGGRCDPTDFDRGRHPLDGPALAAVSALLTGRAPPLLPLAAGKEPEAVAQALNAAGIPSPTGLDWTAERVLALVVGDAPGGTRSTRTGGR